MREREKELENAMQKVSVIYKFLDWFPQIMTLRYLFTATRTKLTTSQCCHVSSLTCNLI